jgi:hypothetical protein
MMIPSITNKERFEVRTAVFMKNTLSQQVTPCSLAYTYNKLRAGGFCETLVSAEAHGVIVRKRLTFTETLILLLGQLNTVIQ